MIYFDEPSHTYRLDDKDNGRLLISATTLIGKYKPPFDEHFWSLYTAMRWLLDMEKKVFSMYLIKQHKFNFKDDSHKTEQKLHEIAYKIAVSWETILEMQVLVLAEWKHINLNSLQRGNVLHLYKEGKHYEKDFYFENQKTDVYESHGSLYKIIESLVVDKPVIIPELRIANREHGIAGSIDQPIFFTGRRFSINDWKTNKKIETDSRYYMLDPIQHIPDCNYFHYALQISLYAWMIEQETGFEVGDLYFTHFKFDDNNQVIGEKIFPVSYLKREIEMILNHYGSTKTNT